jgi:uncharacterized caspase-like protein
MLIGYATSLNRNVVEGEGRNSPFVAALLKHIETPGLEIDALMRNVRDDVHEATGGKQSPASYATTSGNRFLTPR